MDISSSQQEDRKRFEKKYKMKPGNLKRSSVSKEDPKKSSFRHDVLSGVRQFPDACLQVMVSIEQL